MSNRDKLVAAIEKALRPVRAQGIQCTILGVTNHSSQLVLQVEMKLTKGKKTFVAYPKWDLTSIKDDETLGRLLRLVDTGIAYATADLRKRAAEKEKKS